MNSQVIRFDRAVCSRLDLALLGMAGGRRSGRLRVVHHRRIKHPPLSRIADRRHDPAYRPPGAAVENRRDAGGWRSALRALREPISGRDPSAGLSVFERIPSGSVSSVRLSGGRRRIEKRVFMVHGENTTVIEPKKITGDHQGVFSRVAPPGRISRLSAPRRRTILSIPSSRLPTA